LNFGNISKQAARRFVNFLFPWGICKLCGKKIICQGAVPEICLSCFKTRKVIADPTCKFCDRELPSTAEAGTCGLCLIETPSYEKHFSRYHYAGVIREFVLLYKVGMKYPLAKIIGGSIARGVIKNCAEEKFDYVTFVPGPFKRKLSRRFSPAELVAKTVSKKLQVPLKSLLSLKKNPKPQKGLTARERKENIKGVFFCASGFQKGTKILLIDDIFTTGSTIEEASKVLKKKGALVYAATFAMRTKRDFFSEKGLDREEDITSI
jgi:competence protein ComFC